MPHSYRIEEEIGRGGMGVVYRAYHAELDRHVAIKFLAPSLCHDPDFVQRFLREARHNARIDHPNVVRVFDAGIDERKRPYLVMELLQGQSLRESLRKGPMEPNEAVRIARGVLAALAASHSHGVIHRDVKPANIFLTQRGEAKLMDFGIALSNEDSRMTSTGVPIGTAEYMSPEQARGGTTDIRTDLYAVGIVLYQMLKGAPPFQADSTLAVMQMHLSTPPPAIPGIPEWLRAVVMRSLAKDPAQRYASATEMAEALRPSSSPASPPRRPQATYAMGGAVVVLLGLIAVVASQGQRPSPAPTTFKVEKFGQPSATVQSSETPVVQPEPEVENPPKEPEIVAPTAAKLIGTWNGYFGNRAARLKISASDGDRFQGSLWGLNDRGPVQVAVEGRYDAATGGVTMRETAVLTPPPLGRYTLGVNSGRVDPASNAISGTGRDTRSAQYRWAYKRATPSPPPPRPRSGWKRFTSEYPAFTVDLPEGWSDVEIDSFAGRRVFIFKRGEAEFRVDLGYKTQGSPQASPYTLEKGFLKNPNLHDYYRVDIAPDRIHCREAARWHFTLASRRSASEPFKPKKEKEIFYFRGGANGYALMFSVPDGMLEPYEHEFYEIRNAFRLTDEPCSEVR